jgi:hypothetical protein
VGGFVITAASLMCVVATLHSWIAVLVPLIGLVLVVCVLLVIAAFELENVSICATEPA